jgi:thiamine-phosphate pyrophosphorylase
VTNRAAVGDARFRAILRALAGAPALTVELREKESTDRERVSWAVEAREALGPSVPVLVNRRFDVALAAGAAGVHLPADGLPLAGVRAHTPRGFRVGVSTHSPEEASAALEAGADIVVIGPIFDTPSKRRFGAPLGVEALGRLPLRSSRRAEVTRSAESTRRPRPARAVRTASTGRRDPPFQEAADQAAVSRISAP